MSIFRNNVLYYNHEIQYTELQILMNTINILYISPDLNGKTKPYVVTTKWNYLKEMIPRDGHNTGICKWIRKISFEKGTAE